MQGLAYAESGRLPRLQEPHIGGRGGIPSYLLFSFVLLSFLSLSPLTCFTMHHWNTQKIDSEKPLIPSSQHSRARNIQFLQKTRRIVLVSGIAAFSTWAVIGYSTDWTGGSLPATLSTKFRGCHGSSKADKGKGFTWESVGIPAVGELSDSADSVRIGDSD